MLHALLHAAERRARLRLLRELGNRWRLHKFLLDEFGSATNLFETFNAAHPVAALLPPALVAPLSRRPDSALERRLDKDEAWLAAPGRHLLVAGESGYPAQLTQIYDPPHLLFAEGDASLLETRQLGVVGSRRMSAYGRRTALRLAGDLARNGVTVTSGLALGIDAAAHTGALTAGGGTVAVLGSGCDVHYPPTNRALAARIVAEGVIVSELPLGTPARAHQFPLRNRIVTGLSTGTLVIEATRRSGSLISARLAMEQGREVFAVPGSVESPQSQGCHELIRNGAKLVESIEDISEELALMGSAPIAAPAAAMIARYKEVLVHLDTDPMSVDEIAGLIGKRVPDLLGVLTELEIEGLVARDAGGYRLATQPLESGL